MRKQSFGVAIALAALLSGTAYAANNSNSSTDSGATPLVRAQAGLGDTSILGVGQFDHAAVVAALHAAAAREAAAREAAAQAAAAAARRDAAARASRSSRAPRVVVAGADVWARLRQCESGGNYASNTGNGYYGAYQASHSTWGGYAGYSDAHLAPPAVQDEWARALHARRGWQPWPACSRKLGLR
jgi:hypothetical protein